MHVWRGTVTRILQEIYSNRTDIVFFFNDKLYKKGALPCAGEYSCTSSKKNVLKAFLISRSIVNIPLNGQLRLKEKQKRYFARSF